jgi:dienelactone hydrolase
MNLRSTIAISFTLVLTSLAISTNTLAESITLEAKDGFSLSANYLKPESSSKRGVLMLHQCNADKSMYSDLATQAAAKGFHTLALDFRGYGKSVDEIFSMDKMEAKAGNRDELVAMVRKMRADHWPSDVELAYQYLADKVGSQNIAFIGASCGGGQAIILAEKKKPTSLTLFSSGMGERGIERFVKLSDIPTLLIAAQGDEFTFNSAKKAFEKAKSLKSKIQLYKGDGHGLPLFNQDPHLAGTMVDWFQTHAK